MPLDYHLGNVTFWIFQTCARISLNDEAEKRKRDRAGVERKQEGEERERVTRVKVRVLVNYETLRSLFIGKGRVKRGGEIAPY